MRDSIRTFCVREQCSVVKRRSPPFQTLSVSQDSWWEGAVGNKGREPCSYKTLSRSLSSNPHLRLWKDSICAPDQNALSRRSQATAGGTLSTDTLYRTFLSSCRFRLSFNALITPHGKWVPRKTRLAPLVRRVYRRMEIMCAWNLKFRSPKQRCAKKRALCRVHAPTQQVPRKHLRLYLALATVKAGGGQIQRYRMLAFPVWKVAKR